MFNFTKQERQVILFLLAVILSGAALDLALKKNAKVRALVQIDSSMVKLDLNKAGINELLSAKGLTKKIAQAIIDYRQAHGQFADIEELQEVKGVGEKRLKVLKEVFFVE